MTVLILLILVFVAGAGAFYWYIFAYRGKLLMTKLQFTGLRGYHTPYLKLACIFFLSQNYHHFFEETNACILKEIVQETENNH